MPDLSRYLHVRSAAVAGALPGGELGFLTDVTGLFQLWQIAADGLHEQVTFGSERITAALPSPAEQAWVIARDSGGNERHQLYRVEPDGRETALTDAPDAIHSPGAFSPDGRRFAFAHTGRNGRDFDVALVGADGTGRREVNQPGGYVEVLDWSDAGILACRLASPFDHHLLLIDPETGDARPITPEARDGEIAFLPAVLLADGSVLCACDAGSEHPRLAVVGADGGIELSTADDADVESVATDRDRTRRAWTVNRDGYSQLYLDGRAVDGLPQALLGNPRFLPDGSVALSAYPADDSADVWVVPAASGAARRRTRSAVGGLPRDGFVRPALHSFETFDGREIPYFLFGEPGRPTLCYVHGGPEAQFRPQLLSDSAHPVIQYLVARGISVAAPNVRGSTGYGRTYHHLDDVEKRLDSVRDLTCLARELGQAGVPVAVMGGSYGGYMTMAAITEEPDLWAAAVNIVGIVNFVTFLERTGAYRRALREPEYGSLERDRELLERISPIRKVDAIRAPLLVVHGANDPRVPVSEAEQVVEALRRRDHPVEYLRYEDEGHGIKSLRNRLDLYPRVAAFLERHLGIGG